MELKHEPIDISQVARGALNENYIVAWNKAMIDIKDPNKPSEKKRVILLKIEIEPDANRNAGVMAVSHEVKVPKGNVHKESFFLRADGSASHTHAGQIEMDIEQGVSK